MMWDCKHIPLHHMHYTDTLMNYAQSISSPVLMVAVLAIVFALDPCLLLTNIAAIGYIGREVENKRAILSRGLYYTLGRTLSYGLLGCTMIAFLQLGKSLHPIEEFVEHYGVMILTVFMILMGVLLCISDYIPWLNINLAKNVDQTRFKGKAGAFMLGVVLTFAFCPTNAILFFGMMVPVCSASKFGYALPFLFSATTAIPVLLIAYIIAFSINSIARYYNKVQLIGKILKWVVGTAFVIIGIYLAVNGVEHHH